MRKRTHSRPFDCKACKASNVSRLARQALNIVSLSRARLSAQQPRAQRVGIARNQIFVNLQMFESNQHAHAANVCKPIPRHKQTTRCTSVLLACNACSAASSAAPSVSRGATLPMFSDLRMGNLDSGQSIWNQAAGYCICFFQAAASARKQTPPIKIRANIRGPGSHKAVRNWRFSASRDSYWTSSVARASKKGFAEPSGKAFARHVSKTTKQPNLKYTADGLRCGPGLDAILT